MNRQVRRQQEKAAKQEKENKKRGFARKQSVLAHNSQSGIKLARLLCDDDLGISQKQIDERVKRMKRIIGLFRAKDYRNTQMPLIELINMYRLVESIERWKTESPYNLQECMREIEEHKEPYHLAMLVDRYESDLYEFSKKFLIRITNMSFLVHSVQYMLLASRTNIHTHIKDLLNGKTIKSLCEEMGEDINLELSFYLQWVLYAYKNDDDMPNIGNINLTNARKHKDKIMFYIDYMPELMQSRTYLVRNQFHELGLSSPI